MILFYTWVVTLLPLQEWPVFVSYPLSGMVIFVCIWKTFSKDINFVLYYVFPAILFATVYEPSLWGIGGLHSGLFSKIRFVYVISSILSLDYILSCIVGSCEERRGLHGTIMPLFLLAIITAFLSILVGLETFSSRAYQSLWYVFNLGATLWIVKNFSLKQAEVASTIIHRYFLFVFGLLIIAHQQGHLKFFLLAFASVYMFNFVRKTWYTPKTNFLVNMLGATLCLSYLISVAPQSMNTLLIAIACMLVCVAGNRTFGGLVIKGVVGLSVFAFFSLILISPLYDGTLPNYMSYGQHLPYHETQSVLQRGLYKFFDDRLPIWIGFYRDFFQDFDFYGLVSFSGRGFFPIYHGSFATLDRAILWDVGVHSTPLELLNNLGLIGALSFGLVYWRMVWVMLVDGTYRSHISSDTFFNVVVIIGFTVSSIFISNYMLQPHFLIFWFFLGVTLKAVIAKNEIE